MHMADALVAPAVAATMYVCSGGAAGFSVKKVRLESDPKKIPVMGVMGEFASIKHPAIRKMMLTISRNVN